MSRLPKALPLALALAALIVFAAFTASCGSSSAQARFVNAISNTPGPFDIDFNGIKEFSSVGFGQASASTYVGVPSGTDTIEALAAGTTTEEFSSTTSLNSGADYTLVATGRLNGSIAPNIMPFVDNNTAPTNGSVNFRVINASFYGPSGSGGAVDVYILANPNPVIPSSCSAAGVNCIADLAYNATKPYVTLPYNSAGSGWQLIVTVTGSTTPYFNDPLPNVGSSAEGSICTLVLTDQANGTVMSSTFVPLNDLNCSGQ
ncbi:MAG: DUF4397 domain-containing protein [Terriglobales bacterium]